MQGSKNSTENADKRLIKYSSARPGTECEFKDSKAIFSTTFRVLHIWKSDVVI
jgi:hypothetical protein